MKHKANISLFRTVRRFDGADPHSYMDSISGGSVSDWIPQEEHVFLRAAQRPSFLAKCFEADLSQPLK